MLAGRYASQTYEAPLSPGVLLEMQTINAAAAAGMDTELGSLQSGKRADVVVRSRGEWPRHIPPTIHYTCWR